MREFQINFDGFFKSRFCNAEPSSLGLSSYYPSTSDDNNFIPYHALITGKLLQVGTSRSLLYSLDVPIHVPYIKKVYEDFFNIMMYRELWTRFDKKNVDNIYLTRVGQLVHLKNSGEVVPLAVIAVHKSHLFHIDKTNPDYSQFFLMIDKKFTEESTYELMWRNFEKIAMPVINERIDTIITRSLLTSCYNHTPVPKIRPVNIVQAKNMYKDLTKLVIKNLSL
jgi:hypothetical protein